MKNTQRKTLLAGISLLLLLNSSTTTTTAQPILASLRYHNDLRLQTETFVRKGNVDVVTVRDENNQDNRELAFCHLPALMSLTSVNNNTRAVWRDAARYTDIPTIALAVQHFNSGNGTVVPELEGIDKRCNIRFTYEIFDSEYSLKKSVRDVIDILYDDITNPNKKLPYAFLGEFRSSVTVATATITGLEDYPQFSPTSTSMFLDNKNQFSHFGRLVPSDYGVAVAIIRYFMERNIDHIAVLFVDDAYGASLSVSLQQAASEIAPQMEIKKYAYHSMCVC